MDGEGLCSPERKGLRVWQRHSANAELHKNF